MEALVTSYLHDAAFRRYIALQNDEAAGRLERVRERAYDVLCRRLGRTRGLLANRAAGDGPSVGVQQPSLEQPLGDERNAARAIEIGGRPASGRPAAAPYG